MSDDNQNFKFSELASESTTSNDSINFSFKNDDDTTTTKTDFVVDTVYISDNVNQGINATGIITEQCVIKDLVVQIAKSSQSIKDKFSITDLVVQAANSSQLIVDQCSITDTTNDHLIRYDLIAEQFVVIDNILDKNRTIVVDQLLVADYDKSYKKANVVVKEKARMTDRSIRVHADTVTDALRVSDTLNVGVRATDTVHDRIVISDQLQSSITFSQHIIDRIAIHDVAKGSLTAKQHLQDYVFIDDLIPNQPTAGYAWTANADTWAMSRYDSYNYQDLAVIDGVLYGLGEDGVYQLDADTPVQAKLTTGKIDLGRGQLVHPVAAYLEYELSGSSKQLQVGVGTTQSGNKQAYFYQLPTEKADYLTNGRVLFGRGLRGRHFSFEINISGEHGYINDLSIDLAATKRRV